MDLLWSVGEPRSVRWVRDELVPVRAWAYTTVQTVMDRLVKKGLLTRQFDGKAYAYRPSASRDDHAAGLMQAALLSSTDAGSTLLHFVERLDPEQQAALLEAVRRQGERS